MRTFDSLLAFWAEMETWDLLKEALGDVVDEAVGMPDEPPDF